MFDGLKKKLNSFRKDVEDTAEEKAEAAAEDAEADAEAELDEPAADVADAEATETTATETGSDAVETDTETADAGSETVDADADAADADAAAVDTDAGNGPVAEPPGDTSGSQATARSETMPDSGTDEAAADDVPEADDDSEDDVPESLASDAAKAALSKEAEDDSSSNASRLKRAAAFATGKVVIEEEDLEDPLWELEMALLQSDVEMQVAEEILDTIREKLLGETRKQVNSTGQLVSEALHDALYEVISVGQFDFDQRIAEADKPVTLIFTGINGVGKTTTIAKLARYFEKQGYSTVLANGDTYRAGANEQIREHADALDKKLISHEQGGDPAAVIYDAVEYAEAHDIDIVLGDTAGRLHTSNDLMAQLEKIDRVVGPDLTIFVDEAVAGQDAVERARQFNDAAAIDGAILTKADADSNGGAAISIAYVTGKPILFLGVGQGYDHIERFDPEAMVDRLLGEEE
ncbi:signal recognition particle-docking protein FtsY [Haloferax mediterranei ATCC 33500]|uniref:Signal recognition particle receptor FtsY n=1 Tax=Haloferax mediterranei (strain ATCC 33500 / DSM 1411 / JCM 8866 / NBRC 14739 / NCIMB 2177 / R-4) TaxID=523841 RepID=I3R0W3_HALMT|nr:signal recognition particle-docking protein FtsY [Haloferax mediterranei]AFK17873.1 signal recognition particle receptor SRalpha [Haloferax mediterranei ATCC 33500]AHZ22705.1 cell division protein FtsY [Haloferax mediterranei ATCC 33500]EMA02854.1 cell division protein FtsY [Haloferax mediterranei ATCC 33500]MDX5987961.1 signal recognition particle-docking protein FtsY [Haloferax mediterranei ATCC 33500]QCQ74430.1 signal recognition particle-docking protein FtsY [Haloferax mediterranei ATCC